MLHVAKSSPSSSSSLLTLRAIFAPIAAVALALVACGAPASESVSHSGQAVSIAADPAFTQCKSDDECVAIAQAGCCHNGWLVAVSHDSVDAYTTANTCATPGGLCPMYRVNDQRTAQCSPTSNACELVGPPAVVTDDNGGSDTSTGGGSKD